MAPLQELHCQFIAGFAPKYHQDVLSWIDPRMVLFSEFHGKSWERSETDMPKAQIKCPITSTSDVTEHISIGLVELHPPKPSENFC